VNVAPALVPAGEREDQFSSKENFNNWPMIMLGFVVTGKGGLGT